MAKAKKEKVVEEEIFEEQPTERLPEEIVFEVPLVDVMEQEGVKHPVFIPDFPAQMDNSVPEQPKGETEIQFLQRILYIQENGGFGRHLDKLINDRIKSIS